MKLRKAKALVDGVRADIAKADALLPAMDAKIREITERRSRPGGDLSAVDESLEYARAQYAALAAIRQTAVDLLAAREKNAKRSGGRLCQ